MQLTLIRAAEFGHEKTNELNRVGCVSALVSEILRREVEFGQQSA